MRLLLGRRNKVIPGNIGPRDPRLERLSLQKPVSPFGESVPATLIVWTILCSMKKSHTKRPCSICGMWFEPDPRSRGRQRVCWDPGCQRERHRRACEAWHARQPGWDRETRFRKGIMKEVPTPLPGADPRAGIDWDRVRDAVGAEVSAVIEEATGLLVRWARDAVVAQGHVATGESPRLLPGGARDAIDPPARPCEPAWDARAERTRCDRDGSDGTDEGEQAE